MRVCLFVFVAFSLLSSSSAAAAASFPLVQAFVPPQRRRHEYAAAAASIRRRRSRRSSKDDGAVVSSCQPYDIAPAASRTTTTSSSSLQMIMPTEMIHDYCLSSAAATTTATSMWLSTITASHPPDISILFPHGSITNVLDSYGLLLKNQPVTTKAITSGILATVGDAIAQIRSSKAQQVPVPSQSSAVIDNQPDAVDADVNAANDFEYNAKRGLAFLVFGALYTGAFQHYWFQFMSNHLIGWGAGLHLWGSAISSGDAVGDVLLVDQMYHSQEWWMYFDVVNIMKSNYSPPIPDAVLAVAKLSLNQFGMVPLFYMPTFFALTGALADLSPQQSLERAKSMYWPILKRNYFYWLPVQFIQFFAIKDPDWQIPFLSVGSLIWTVILSSIAASQQQQQEESSSSSSTYDESTTTDISTTTAIDSADPASAATTGTFTSIGSSSYVVYDETDDGNVQILRVNNEDVTDNIWLEDVLDEQEIDPQVIRGATVGGLFALLAASADEGMLASGLASSLFSLTTNDAVVSAAASTSAAATDGGANPIVGAAVAFLTTLGAATGIFVSTTTSSSTTSDISNDVIPSNASNKDDEDNTHDDDDDNNSSNYSKSINSGDNNNGDVSTTATTTNEGSKKSFDRTKEIA